MKVEDFQLSILIISDDEITRLNKQYFNKNNPTDVIAFPMQKGDFANINPNLLGDIVISAQRAQDQAIELDHSVEHEMDVLIVHGILHLLGFEDSSPKKKKIMFEKMDEIINTMEASKP